MERESIVQLLQKLLALSKSGNENEASLAMAKAQELLIKYNLDLASINTGDNGNGNDEATLINEVVNFDKLQPWRRTLLTVVSEANFCQSIKLGFDGSIHILGRKANVRAVVEIYNWIEPQIISLANHSPYVRIEKTSYILGILKTLQQRLAANKIQYQRANPGSTALVVSIQAEVDGWFKQQYPNSRTSGHRSIAAGAYGRGNSDGHGVSICGTSRQVGSRVLQLGC